MSGTDRVATMFAQADGADLSAEQQRQATLMGKHAELQRLAQVDEDSRRKAGEALGQKQRILDELRGVRGQMQDRMLGARAKGAHHIGVANRGLGAAAHRADMAQGSADHWRARAADVQAHARGVQEREDERRRKHAEASKPRILDAQSLAGRRVELGHKLVAETDDVCRQLAQRHTDQCESRDSHAKNCANIKAANADKARRDATEKVREAIEKSSRSQVASMKDIQKSREEAVTKIARMQQDLLEKRRECEAVLERERICAAQARKIAKTGKEQQDAERDDKLRKLEAQLLFNDAQAKRKAQNFDHEANVAELRDQDWTQKTAKRIGEAEALAEAEAQKAVDRVDRAKVQLKNLQAQCASYIRSLMEQWEEAKQDNAAKVDASEYRFKDLVKYCEQTLKECEDYCAKMVKNNEVHAENKKTFLEEKVSVLDGIHKHRVDMMEGQSRDRRLKAEKQLADLQRHIEDVRAQCASRHQEEAGTAQEKVRIARERFSAEVHRAEQRAADAEDRRRAALDANIAVQARCQGSAQESRRRGLNDIADVIEPPYQEPSVEELAAARQQSVGMSETDKLGLTGTTAAPAGEEENNALDLGTTADSALGKAFSGTPADEEGEAAANS